MKSRSPAILLGLLIVGVAAAVSWWLLRSAPVQGSRETTRSAKIVQTIRPEPADRPVSVSAHGSVIPTRRLIVRPEITGRITSHHPALVPGGLIAEGETLFTIDDSDYRIALREAVTTLEEARAEVALEEGRQTVARREWEQLRRDMPEAEINRALVLREPFKARTEALLERATAAVAMAELQLARTTVTAPFNAVVIDESVESGQLADSGTPLATLVGTDAFWIQANVPLSALGSVRLPAGDQPGAGAMVELATASGPPLVWQGRVVRLLSDLEDAGRLARVLVEVPAPLDSNPVQPLLLGSYVRVAIEAGTLAGVLEIPRAALREGDRVWVVGEDKQLVIRDAGILWREENTLLISPLLEPGEALIVSDLNAPLPGMALAPEPLANPSQR